MGKVITLEIPNHLFATKVEGVSPHPDTGEFIKYLNDFNTLRIAPDTLIGRFRHVVTDYNKLQELCDFRQGYSDPSEPDYIDLLIYFISKGVKLRHDIKFKRGENKYFGLDLYIKVSNSQYSLAKMPVGSHNCIGSGEEGDAAIDDRRTYKQFVDNTKDGNLNHENDTHKFFHYSSYGSGQVTHDEFVAMFNNIATVNDVTKFDILSPREFNEQVELDNAE